MVIQNILKSERPNIIINHFKKNKTNIFYQFYADPEISFPVWITNLFIVN